ncbi:MAG: hypothetical protein AABX47_02020 [Nanoarchaeota archaeon]
MIVDKSSLLELAGILEKKEVAGLRKAVKDVRKDIDERLEKTTDCRYRYPA